MTCQRVRLSSPQLRDPEVFALKLPEFLSSDSKVWFITVESLFRRHRLTSQLTMSDHVVGALPPHPGAVVRDALLAPPADHPYDHPADTLIRSTTDSEQHRLQQLITLEENGDCKPTDLLRRVQPQRPISLHLDHHPSRKFSAALSNTVPT
uniref:DUF7041 domain-containing protein n=1 Tax=Rhipicephalus sanguineus TaxID=34632 RepID=A0A9D4TCR9_RHISA|nr:hypothetical protein HPB52_025698 [Rhipicephalus sanguineus]